MTLRAVLCTYSATLTIGLCQPGSIDTSFVAAPVSGGFALTVQPDGKILVGGGGITRLNTDGSSDTNFNAAVDGQVWSIAVQNDSKILIGGLFGTVNGTNRANVARLNPNGALDDAFLPATIPSGAYVFSVVPQPDGLILIGGEFATVGGISRRGIARLTGNGTLDAFFNPGTGVPSPGVTDSVRCIALQDDGRVLIGGLFPSFNGTPRSNFARLNSDGSSDTNFVALPGPDGFVYSIAIQPDAAILLVGGFTKVHNQPNSHVARLQSNGQLDGTFDGGSGVTDLLGINMVTSVKLQGNGDIIIGGGFATVRGLQRNGIAKLHSNGTLDMDFVPATPNRSQAYVLTLQPDSKVIVSGSEGLLRLDNFPPGIQPATLSLATYAGLSIQGTVGGRYRIEYSTDADTNVWTFLENLILPRSPYLFIDSQPTTQPRRFYRALTAP